MKALIVILCVLFVLWLLGRIRVGAAVRYSAEGLFLAFKAGLLRLPLLPRKKGKTQKAAKEKRPDKKKPKKAGDTKPERNGKDTLKLAMRFIPLLGEAAGRLRRKIRIDHLTLHVIWAASDPASAAMGYGAGNAVLGILWPPVEHNFHVKQHDLRVDVDFDREKPVLETDAQITLTIGQIVSLALILGVKAFNIFLGYRREKNEEKAVQQ